MGFTWKESVFTVAASIGSEKVALTMVLTGTILPRFGLVAVILGDV
jgi:hypothetical protein